MLRLGSIPYTDPSVEASNRACKHRPVVLARGNGGYKLRVEGFSEGELPPANPDVQAAIALARKFIRRNKGAALKRPAQHLGVQQMRAQAKSFGEQQRERRDRRRS